MTANSLNATASGSLMSIKDADRNAVVKIMALRLSGEPNKPMIKPNKAHECLAKAAECEIRVARTKDRELKEYYSYMARDW
jgi:hypothetical protein